MNKEKLISLGVPKEFLEDGVYEYKYMSAMCDRMEQSCKHQRKVLKKMGVKFRNIAEDYKRSKSK